MRRLLVPSISLILGLVSALAFTQDKQPPIQRKDSVSVSAGISKEQLDLEARLAAVLSGGDQALRNGHTADAVKQYEIALAMIDKEPLLAEQRERVLRKVGNGYIHAERPTDGVAIFQRLVGLTSKECDSETFSISACADAQQSLGGAKMRAGDIEGGLASLRLAAANYKKAVQLSEIEKPGEFHHEYMMIQVMNQAQTKLLMAVALFRLGKSADAITTAEDAIPELHRVEDDGGINDGIRQSATNSLKDAQTILERLKSAP
jgi:tetratricopeptide (TPR) repeat protein